MVFAHTLLSMVENAGWLMSLKPAGNWAVCHRPWYAQHHAGRQDIRGTVILDLGQGFAGIGGEGGMR